MPTLTELFYEARKYGPVRLTTLDDGKYHSNIDFRTVKGIDLSAKSSFDCITPEQSLSEALLKAVKVIDSLESLILDTSTTKKLLGVNNG